MNDICEDCRNSGIAKMCKSESGQCEHYHPELEIDRLNIVNEILRAKLKALTKKLEREWIPVSERLPEEYEQSSDVYDIETLAVTDTKYFKSSDLVIVTVYDYDKDKTFVCDDITVDSKWCNFESDSFNVLAWQPLPQPYKEDAK